MAKKRERNKGENPKLEMTPMIDVVFQLLIFFIVTLKQEDILSQLLANRPAPDAAASPDKQPDLLTIEISKDGFILNRNYVKYAGLDDGIKKISRYSKEATVLIKCTADSPHRFLVQALDVCNKYGMKNLSIFSL